MEWLISFYCTSVRLVNQFDYTQTSQFEYFLILDIFCVKIDRLDALLRSERWKFCQFLRKLDHKMKPVVDWLIVENVWLAVDSFDWLIDCLSMHRLIDWLIACRVGWLAEVVCSIMIMQCCERELGDSFLFIYDSVRIKKLFYCFCGLSFGSF